MLDEYQQPHKTPWVIGYSGGKDSTLLVHLTFEMLLSLPPSERSREVHVVANDTLVESPLVIDHMKASLEQIGRSAAMLQLPIVSQVTEPEVGDTFWVNLIGRGYPTPNRNFRWCTDRMKIQPTSKYIKSQVNAAGEAILLLGVRKDESSKRAASIKKHTSKERLNPHSDLKGCFIFSPIVDVSTEEVWNFLSINEPPWGSSHLKLIGLYRQASGGECPVVTQKTDIASCGTTSSRFGCWTCTVVAKDRSLEGFLESGYSEFSPLVDFREWLVEIRDVQQMRQGRRRNGKVTLDPSGKLVMGPFTLEARQLILDKLLEVQKTVNRQLISEAEIETINHIWLEDIAKNSDIRDVKIQRSRERKNEK